MCRTIDVCLALIEREIACERKVRCEGLDRGAIFDPRRLAARWFGT